MVGFCNGCDIIVLSYTSKLEYHNLYCFIIYFLQFSGCFYSCAGFVKRSRRCSARSSPCFTSYEIETLMREYQFIVKRAHDTRIQQGLLFHTDKILHYTIYIGAILSPIFTAAGILITHFQLKNIYSMPLFLLSSTSTRVSTPVSQLK